VSAEHTKYLYQHVEISLTRLGALLKGKVPIGSGNIEFSEFTAKAVKALEQEGEASVKRMEKFIEEGKKAYKEGLFAKLAVNCTILAIAILCAFTVVSLRLLF
jgi:Na+/H+-translocating membrane pyrophosphatase